MKQINREYYRERLADKNISDMDRVIAGYIQAMGEENCGEAVRCDPRGEVGFHLGRERQLGIAWYPFKEDAAILEVGGEFGALTGVLCQRAERVIVSEPSFFRACAIGERYASRDNLEIYAGHAEEMQFPCQFDYIIIFDVVNKIGNQAAMDMPYIRALTYLSRYLKPDGKFLLATDNLYSLFNCQNGVALNPWNHTRLLHRAQIRRILEEAGLPFCRFYYPLPNYHTVGRVYSDAVPPTAAEWNCLLDMGCLDQNFLSNNMDMLSKLTDNGMFADLAPAFFVEAAKEDVLSRIGSANGLIDETFELPVAGFDWGAHGKGFLADAIEKYRQKDAQSFSNMERYKASIWKMDQDHEEMEKVLAIELDLLHKLHEVCEKHGLKLFLMYGTLLGAVRSAGMLQGDDDIDVALTREDFNRLLTLQEEFGNEYFLQTPANDACFFGGYLKLRNRNTTAIHPQNWWVDCCEGIGIDIFPLDGGYADAEKEERKQKRVQTWQRFLYAKAYGYFARFHDMKLLKWKAYKYIGKLFSREWMAEQLNKAMAETDGSKNAPFGVYAHYLAEGATPRWLDRDAFEEVIDMPYEGMLLKAPFDWDRILRMRYGEQYMDSAGWSEWKMRHGFYSASTPYQVYKKRYSGLFRPEPGPERRIVLFGDGYVFKTYFMRYKSDHRPSEIVLLRGEREEESLEGILVKTIREFSCEDRETIYPVICSADIRGAEKALQQMGLSDYYIFVYNRDWIRRANWTSVMTEARSLG